MAREVYYHNLTGTNKNNSSKLWIFFSNKILSDIPNEKWKQSNSTIHDVKLTSYSELSQFLVG